MNFFIENYERFYTQRNGGDELHLYTDIDLLGAFETNASNKVLNTDNKDGEYDLLLRSVSDLIRLISEDRLDSALIINNQVQDKAVLLNFHEPTYSGLFICGGVTPDSECSNESFCVSIKANSTGDNSEESWNLSTQAKACLLHSVRYAAATALIDKTVFVTGGRGDDSHTSRIVQLFHSDINEWTIGPDLLIPRWAHSCCAQNQLVYVVGGDGTEKSTHRLDNRVSSWQRLANTNDDHEWGTRTTVVDESVFVIGGWKSNSVEVFDAAAAKWRRLASMTQERCQHAVCVLDCDVFVFGSGNSPCKTCERYSPRRDEWITVADLPIDDWSSGAAFVSNGRIVCLGGWSLVKTKWTVQKQSLVLDVNGNCWTKLTQQNSLKRRAFASTIQL